MKPRGLYIILGAAALLIGLGAWYVSVPTRSEKANNQNRICIKATCVPVERAETETQRARGLSFRDQLPKGTGMLFVFLTKGYHAFWMKDMRFPLDIIWIADDRIVDIKSNLPPGQGNTPPVYTPIQESNYVLEINVGEAATYGWNIGDAVEIQRARRP